MNSILKSYSLVKRLNIKYLLVISILHGQVPGFTKFEYQFPGLNSFEQVLVYLTKS